MINLDTAAPVITFGAVERVSSSRVEVPYSNSPDTQDMEATCTVLGGSELPVLDEGARFIIESVPEGALLLTLTIAAEDDVSNTSITTKNITVSVFELRAKLRVLPALVSRVTIRKFFRITGSLGKTLRGWLKIDQGDR